MKEIIFKNLHLNGKNSEIEVTFNEQIIKVKQYLPVQQKLDMIGEILSLAVDVERPYFYDIGRFEIMYVIKVIQNYSNIKFNDTDLNHPGKLYDIIVDSGLWDQISENIPTKELKTIRSWSFFTMNKIIQHTQSALGIMEAMKNDYNSLDMDATALQNKISNPENLAFLKEIMPLIAGNENEEEKKTLAQNDK